MIGLEVVAAGVAVVVIFHGAWWSLLCVVALRRPSGVHQDEAELSIVALVPAHDEEALIGACVKSLVAAARGRHEVIVVADNCSDETAPIAREAGAAVIERAESDLRGKSFALDLGLAALAARERPPGAVAFVDGDSTVSDNFFDALACRLSAGADAVQVHYEVEPGPQMVQRLRRLAFSLVHWSRPLGAARLGLGTGIKGNGMALRWELVRDGFGARGLAEDAALTLALAARGVRVVFEPGATVRGFMSGSYSGARLQDRRWEQGRLGLAPRALRTALIAAWRREPECAAGALEIASLPLSLLVLGAVLVAGAAATGLIPAWLGTAPAVSLLAYVALGLTAARTPLSEVLALRGAPGFFLHKLSVYGGLLVRKDHEWRRTERR